MIQKVLIVLLKEFVQHLFIYTSSYLVDLILIDFFRSFFIIMNVSTEVFLKTYVLLYFHDGDSLLYHK